LAPLAGVARTLARLRLAPADAAEQRRLTERPGPAAGPDAPAAPAAGADAPTVPFAAFEALLGARLAAAGRDVLALAAEVPATCFSAVAKAQPPPPPPGARPARRAGRRAAVRAECPRGAGAGGVAGGRARPRGQRAPRAHA
jgi:hypothetical protein